MEGGTGRKILRADRVHIWQIRAFFSMGIFYLFYYFCKYNLGVATPEIQKEFGFSSELWGLITTTVFALVYAGGQFVNGFLGDRYGPKRIMLIGGLGGVVVSVFFGWSNGLVFFTIFWLLNAYFSSCGWAPGSRILFNWFPEKRWGTWMGVYNALCYSGGAIVTIVAGFAIHYWGTWRAAFFVPAAFLFVMTVIFWILGKSSPRDAGFETDWEQEKQTRRAGKKEYWGALSNCKMILAYVSGFGANFVRWGIISWLVKILHAPVDAPVVTERGFGVHIAAAGVIASLAHWGGALFSLVLGAVSDLLFKGKRWQTIAIGFFIGAIPLFWLAQGPEVLDKRVLFEVKLKNRARKSAREAQLLERPQRASASEVPTPAGADSVPSGGRSEERFEVLQVTRGLFILGLAIFIAGGLIQAIQTPLFDLPGDILGSELGGTGVGILDGWMYIGASFAGVFMGWWLDSYGLVSGIWLMAVVSVASGLVAIPIQK